MRRILVELLEKYPILYNMLLIIKYHNDDDFMQEIKGLRKNPNFIELKENLDKCDKNEVWCDISIGGPNEGFFALVRWTLDALYFCECFGLKPFIRFCDDCLYYDINMPLDMNVFDYYFDQPFQEGRDSLRNAKGVVVYKLRNRLKAEMLNGGVTYQVTEKYIVEMANIMKKYLKFNAETQRIISEKLCILGLANNVLGVHIRGTDYKLNCKNHPQYIPPECYYHYIDRAVNEYGFDKIFIATDDSEILEEFLGQYGEERVIFAKDTVRRNGNQGIHTVKTSMKRVYHKYQLGLEVICDMCSLAACGGIVSSLSQVSLMSRIYKKSKDENFRYDKKIDNGVNKGGKVFKVRDSD